jgi:hypothetical protein
MDLKVTSIPKEPGTCDERREKINYYRRQKLIRQQILR